jgi:hypothetical protein
MSSPSSQQGAACTIISPNYLPYARTLAASYREQHPGQPFFVLIVADLTDPKPFAAEPFTAILVSELGLPNLRALAMMYDILELNTNVKPSFMKYLLHRFRLVSLVYLDPDIFVYAPLTPVFEALESSDAVLTPHITSPVDDGKLPSEQDHLYNGTYNLGFFAVRNSPEGLRLLDWWERRCLENGFSEGRTGLFVDQKWMNLAPGLFAYVKILRDPGCNMAYWNLQERKLVESAGGYVVHATEANAQLRFFHFSGIVPGDPDLISNNTNRFTLADRPDVRTLFAQYGLAVIGNRGGAAGKPDYGFDKFSDGTAITRLARRMFAQHQRHFPQADPFASSGPWLAFCRSEKLVAGKAAPVKSTWSDFSGTDRRVTMLHRLLRLTLRLLGPNRYELLMRYLAFISVLRNQSVFLCKGLPPDSEQPLP